MRRVPEAPGRAVGQVLEAEPRRAGARRAGARAAGRPQPLWVGPARRHCSERGRLRGGTGLVEHLKSGRAKLDGIAGPQGLGVRDPLAVDERSVRGSEILDRQLIAGSPGDPGVIARQLRILAEPALARRCAPDKKLVLERDLRAACLASGYPEPFTSQVAAPVSLGSAERGARVALVLVSLVLVSLVLVSLVLVSLVLVSLVLVSSVPLVSLVLVSLVLVSVVLLSGSGLGFSFGTDPTAVSEGTFVALSGTATSLALLGLLGRILRRFVPAARLAHSERSSEQNHGRPRQREASAGRAHPQPSFAASSCPA